MKTPLKLLPALISLQALLQPAIAQTNGAAFRVCIQENLEELNSGKLESDLRRVVKGNQALFSFLYSKALDYHIEGCERIAELISRGLSKSDAERAIANKWWGEAIGEWRALQNNRVPAQAPVLVQPNQTSPSRPTRVIIQPTFQDRLKQWGNDAQDMFRPGSPVN